MKESIVLRQKDTIESLVHRLRIVTTQKEIFQDYATSRLCPDHRGKWVRGRCVLCENEHLSRRLNIIHLHLQNYKNLSPEETLSRIQEILIETQP